MQNEILLIPDKEDQERDSLAAEWIAAGGEVSRIGKFWIKPDVQDKRVSIYGYDSFCLVLAQVLNLEMEMVEDELIAELSYKYVKRRIEIKAIKDMNEQMFPKFIKPVTPKLFKAEIYNSIDKINEVIKGIEESERLICSEEIEIEAELRSFILGDNIMDLAFYEGTGSIEEAKLFIQDFLFHADVKLPRTFVLDVAYNTRDGWFVIEFNSSWGAGLNFCNPKKVIKCIREATIN